ncbi:MAG: FG-GAP-like repeat-containing protein [Coleofasciculus sp. G3-WIS-01]|uniref:hypothetical protein n=1 Tax=Coleofasciculus sp. G3-WIS-01 TaxID=3069528 RepID=UPI0032F9BD95
MPINIAPSTIPNGFVIDEILGNLFGLGYVVKGNGDFDGDGFNDFLISAPGAGLGLGELHVVFGSNDLTTSSTQTISLNSQFSPQVSVSIGNINGDGTDDIIIGDPFANNTNNQGRTYVLYGDISRSIATDVTSLLPGQGFTIVNSDSNANISDALGWSVSSGDIDGDGTDDVIIGDPAADSNNGNVHVIFGTTLNGGHSGTFDISTAPPTDFLTFSDPSPSPNPKGLGFSVGSGDINGNNKDDVIIGAPDTNNFNGETYVVFGYGTRGSIATSTTSLTGANGFIFKGASQEILGWKVSSAGDINGDSNDDFIVSAPSPALNLQGRAYVVYGNNSGFPSTLTTSSIINGTGTDGFYIDGLNNNDSLGGAISAAGDVNGDGIDDFLIAAPYADTNSLNDSGQVYLVYGRQGGFGSNPKLDLNSLAPDQGWFVEIDGLADNDLTGFSVSDAGDVNGDGIDDFLIGASGTNGGVGTNYVVLGQETDKPIPDTTVVDITGAYPLIGERRTFIVSFDNVASSPGNVGYAPFVNLYLDTTGTDGMADNNGVMTDTYDGLTLIPNGIRYILDQDISSVVDPDTGNTISDGLHSVPLSVLGIQPILATIYLDNSGNLVVDHPYAGTIEVPSGFNQGDTLYVIPLPQGSFTPDQPDAKLEIDVQISNLADYNQPLKLSTSGGFRLGANAVSNSQPIDPIMESNDDVTENYLKPLLYRISKHYTGPENETVTGENFSKQYNISVGIAPGQTIDNLAIQDILPDNLQFKSVVSTSGGTPTITKTPPGSGGTLSAAFPNPVTGNASLNFDFYIPLLDNSTTDVIKPKTGNAVTSTDIAKLDPSLVWNPLDPRDGQPFAGPYNPPDNTATTFIEPNATHTLYDRSLAIQKTWNRVLPNGDTKALGLSPGDVIEYTMNFQVSDYFAFGNVNINDIFSDGQKFDTSFTPTFTINEHNVVTTGSFTNSGDFTFVDPSGGSSGTVNLDISQALLSLAPQSNPNDKLLGGNIFDSGGYGATFGATTGQIKFRTVIQEDFTGSFPDTSVDNGDFFRNTATITGDVLNVNPGQNFAPHIDTGNNLPFNESDSSRTYFYLPRGKFNSNSGQDDGYEVSVFQIKDSDGNLKTGNTVVAGDEVTYRIKYTLPFADIEQLKFTSFLPLPVFNESLSRLDITTVHSGPPVLEQIVYGPMDTLNTFYGSVNPIIPSTGPNLSVGRQNNSLLFNYGNFDDPGTVAPQTIDLLYTLEVGDQVTENNLLLTNLVYEQEGSTNGGSRAFAKYALLELAQPELKITQGVVATSDTKAVFSEFFPVIGNSPNPPTLGFTAPGTPGVRFTGTIDSETLSTTNYFDSDITADLSDAPGSNPAHNGDNNLIADLVTYAIILENTGTSPNGAFDVLIKDNLPTGLKIPIGGLNLQVAYGNGALINSSGISFLGGGPDGISGTPDDLFGNGIRLNDSATGAIAAYNSTSGDNVVVITYDLEVDDELADETIITNTAILEEYSSSEGGAKFLPGSQSLTDDAQVKTQPYLQEQFHTFLDLLDGMSGNLPPNTGVTGAAGETFTALPYLGSGDLTYNVIVNKGPLTVYDSTSGVNNLFNPFDSIDLTNLEFQFKPFFGFLFNGGYTVSVEVSDSDTTNNPAGIDFDVQDTFDFTIDLLGKVTNNDIIGATVFFDANRNGELDNNESFAITDAQGSFTFTDDLLIYDTNSDGILDISEGQIVSLGGINTATGLTQDTALIASPDASVVTPLTTVIAELIRRGLTQQQANDLFTNAFSIPNTIDINTFNPVEAINNNQADAVTAYTAHSQIAILISQAATIVSHFANASPSQILDNLVGAIANKIQSGKPLDLTNPTQLEPIITNGAGIPAGNTSLIQGFAQIIAAANQTIQDFANTLPIESLEVQFAKVEKVALAETKQDIQDVLNGKKTITQAIEENTGKALQNQIDTALVFSADPTDIALTNTAVAENLPIGAAVGTLSSVDSELGETHSYSLVSGTGDTDNNVFEIVGNTLKTKASFDYETQNSYNIRVQTSDGNGGIFWKEFTIGVTDGNEILEIVGTEKSDILFGTPDNDIIDGLGGNDIIYANQGDNTIYGGTGIDRIDTGDGNNFIDAGDGNDTIYAGNGDNIIYGGVGIDRIDTGDGNNFIDAGAGNDTIYVGNGDNIIYGGLGNNTIWLGGGQDTVILELGDGFDSIHNFQLDQTIFQLGAGLTTDDLSIFDSTNGAEIFAGSDRLAVVNWTQASVIQNNLSSIFV